MLSGYHGTSIDDILQHSGVVKSNFYYHFQSKNNLALAVVDFWTEDYDANLIHPALGRGSGAVDGLKCLYEIAASTQRGDDGLVGCPLAALSSELASEMPGVQEKLDVYFSSVAERICTLLLSDTELCFSKDRASRISLLAVATLEGGLLLSGLRRSDKDIQSAGKALVEFLQEG